ncbi:putative Na+/H+ antiporter [Methylacidiphilum caldifontis]|uniref:Na+/H+ antiporter n=1 Tax=Methylacidiphilum caldifontis TaxID=2795386 RepID=A0A4Y8PCC6_9BACT|nr:putative Na+/H+ antiporter [Methylacidiphilum caldifontis]TFE68414.1 hypothetical protein A7Q10_08565 [Methylacidiphilum caldifontis]
MNSFDYLASGFFFLAVVHTLFSPFLFHKGSSMIDYALQKRNIHKTLPQRVYFWGALLRFVGEVEIIFGLWLLPLFFVLVFQVGWDKAFEVMKLKGEYPEAFFVSLLMIISSTNPILSTFQRLIGLFCPKKVESVARWWFWILTLGPIFGSLITEASAMTLSALLLKKNFFVINPNPSLAYGTIGLLFFNISIGGALTNFAAPPVVLVANKWRWDSLYILVHFGALFILGMIITNLAYYFFFRKEFNRLETERKSLIAEAGNELLSPLDEEIPLWIRFVNFAFLAAVTLIPKHFVLMLGELIFFFAFMEATKDYQGEVPWLKAFLVGFFLFSLEVFGNLQSWWVNRLLSHLSFFPLYLSSVLLSSFNDNALVSYVATLIVPEMDESRKRAIIAGALSGGGLTILANAPNLAGLSLLRDFFPEGFSPIRLFKMAVIPTAFVTILFILKEVFVR